GAGAAARCPPRVRRPLQAVAHAARRRATRRRSRARRADRGRDRPTARPVREDVLRPPAPRFRELRPGREHRAAGGRRRGGGGGERGEKAGVEVIADFGLWIADWMGRGRSLHAQSTIRNRQSAIHVFLSSGTRHPASVTARAVAAPPSATAAGVPIRSASVPTSREPSGASPTNTNE